jgi:hypothetical protein
VLATGRPATQSLASRRGAVLHTTTGVLSFLLWPQRAATAVTTANPDEVEDLALQAIQAYR